MLYDMHVHVARLHCHEATDRFLLSGPNLYVRMYLRNLGLPKACLRQVNANEVIRQRLLDWVAQSSIHRFVLLAMDGVYGRDGQADAAQTRWMADNDFVADLAQSHPSLLFGASVHPYRPNAVAELRRVIARGAALVKWIPSAQHIRLDDPTCVPFYELLAQHGVPLLVHTGNEHASSRSRNDWNDPALLSHPLQRGVKVIAAHCGARMFLHERCYFATFCRMALEYEHLYGDLSAFGIPTRLAMLRKLQKNADLLSKVVYGSDFPAVPMPRWFILSIGPKAVREILHEANPLERPYLLMRKLGVPDAVFSRAGALLRLDNAHGGTR